MITEIIKLFDVTKSRNQVGEIEESIVNSKEVFAEERSVRQSEFYQGFSVGLKPECEFLINDYYDYDNQQLIEYKNIRYSVIRAYRKGESSQMVIVVTNTVNQGDGYNGST